MIEINEIFSDSDKRLALWCETVQDTNDLAIMAENIIESGIDLISVPPEIVSNMWVYLEKKQIKILSRFDFKSLPKNTDTDVSELSKNIKSVFKQGADGAQVFLKMSDFDGFIEKISWIRDDLFFNKEFCLCLDVEDIDISRLDVIFAKLQDIRANSLMFTLSEDMGPRSDFIGRVYGMLQKWNLDGRLYFMLNNNYDRMDQVIRLIESEKPELQDKVKFFLEY